MLGWQSDCLSRYPGLDPGGLGQALPGIHQGRHWVPEMGEVRSRDSWPRLGQERPGDTWSTRMILCGSPEIDPGHL
jgi:hypothetical protein